MDEDDDNVASVEPEKEHTVSEAFVCFDIETNLHAARSRKRLTARNWTWSVSYTHLLCPPADIFRYTLDNFMIV